MCSKKVIFLMNAICMEERLNARRCEEIIKNAGWEVTSTFSQADVIIINTCAVFQEREDAACTLIQDTQKRKAPHQMLLVWGCLPKIHPQRLRTFFQGPAFGPTEIAQLIEFLHIPFSSALVPYNTLPKKDGWYGAHRWIIRLISQYRQILPRFLHQILPSFPFIEAIHPDNAYEILVSSGCAGSCTFCAVKHAKGSVHSKSITEILHELPKKTAQKSTKLFLCADDLGDYGIDHGQDLLMLLDALLNESDIQKIYLREISPRKLIQFLPRFTVLLKSGRIQSITASVQSGSNRILSLMQRGHTAEEYHFCIQELKNAYPPLIVRTAFLVGFPTETEEDFQASLHLINTLPFSFIDIYRYTDRPRTAALDLHPKVALRTQQQRMFRIQKKAFLKMLLNK